MLLSQVLSIFGNFQKYSSSKFTPRNNYARGLLIDSLAGLFQNILADPAYDDGNLYHCSNEKNLRLICPVKVYPSTPPDRIKLAEFYDSKEGQELYSQRKVSIEPLFEIVKDIFNIRTLPVRGLRM